MIQTIIKIKVIEHENKLEQTALFKQTNMICGKDMAATPFGYIVLKLQILSLLINFGEDHGKNQVSCSRMGDPAQSVVFPRKDSHHKHV